MHEKFVIVSEKKKLWKRILTAVLFAVTCVFLLLALMAPAFFSILTVLFAALWYYMAFQTGIEYEYTYYDGEMRFVKIIAKRKRKNITKVQMEDVLAFAPKGDRSVYKYENDDNISYKNLTSGNADKKVYEFVFKGEKGIHRYEMEPDEAMLDEILIKYPRAVIK